MTNFTTKETSQKLYELTGWGGQMIYKKYTEDFHTVIDYTAYSTDFLLNKMPKQIYINESIYYLSLSCKFGDEFKANYITPTGVLAIFAEPEDENPAEALAKALIWLIENNYMEVK